MTGRQKRHRAERHARPGVAAAVLLSSFTVGVPGATGTDRPLTHCLCGGPRTKQREAVLGDLGTSRDHAEPLHAFPMIALIQARPSVARIPCWARSALHRLVIVHACRAFCRTTRTLPMFHRADGHRQRVSPQRCPTARRSRHEQHAQTGGWLRRPLRRPRKMAMARGAGASLTMVEVGRQYRVVEQLLRRSRTSTRPSPVVAAAPEEPVRDARDGRRDGAVLRRSRTLLIPRSGIPGEVHRDAAGPANDAACVLEDLADVVDGAVPRPRAADSGPAQPLDRIDQTRVTWP
jgi:hypothetical protein